LIVSVSRISEIVLHVKNVAASARFYREVVGLTPESPPTDTWAWFIFGDKSAPQRLALQTGPLLFEEHSPLPPGQRWGACHFAMAISRDELDQAVANVKDHGVEVYGPTRFDWMRATSYYFYDPNGHLLEFWSPDEEDSGA